MFRQVQGKRQPLWDDDDDIILSDEEPVPDATPEVSLTDQQAAEEFAGSDIEDIHETNIPSQQKSVEASQIVEDKRKIAEEEEFLKKRRADYSRQEEDIEGERIKQFDKHILSIIQSHEKDFDSIKQTLSKLEPLTDPSPRFSDSSKQGLPRSSWMLAGASIFDVILTNPNLTSDEQIDLLLMLLTDLKYSPYSVELLHQPLIECLLESDSFKQLLRQLYILSLNERNVEFDLDIEKRIWNRLLEDNAGFELFDNVFSNVTSSYKKLFEYIKVWINNLTIPEDILSKCKYIEATLKVKGKQYTHYIPHIYKIGKLRLFDIVIEQLRENRDRFGECHTSAINEMLNLAENVFKTHRYPLLFGGFGHTKSGNIYDMLNSDLDVAKQYHESEKEKFIKNLDEQIRRDEIHNNSNSFRF